jgi:hypothetical protein
MMLVMLLAAASPRASVIRAASKQDTCVAHDSSVNDYLAAQHATVLRVIVSPARIGEGRACINAARAAGYEIYLSLPYDDAWTPQQDAAYFAEWLPYYAPLWAVSVGNEQDLNGGAIVTPPGWSFSGREYRAVWDAVEPVLASEAPRTLRVFGDFSPWGTQIAEGAWVDVGSPPSGVDALAFHAYDSVVGGLRTVPEFSAWAAAHGVSLWLSEQTPALDDPGIVASVLAQSPDVALYNTYYWPEVAVNRPFWANPPPPAAHQTEAVRAITHPAPAVALNGTRPAAKPIAKPKPHGCYTRRTHHTRRHGRRHRHVGRPRSIHQPRCRMRPPRAHPRPLRRGRGGTATQTTGA